MPLIEQINDISSTSAIKTSKETSKVDMMQRQFEKRTNDKWKKALKELNINENLFSDRQELIQREPFSKNNIKLVQQGEFKDKQLDKIVLEVKSFEVINGCF